MKPSTLAAGAALVVALACVPARTPAPVAATAPTPAPTSAATAAVTARVDEAPPAPAPAPFPCPVTSPNGSAPPGEKPSGSHHGNGELWTALWPEGSVVFRPGGPGAIGADGSLEMKWPWWGAVPGQLTIEGRRLDGPAPSLEARVPQEYGFPGFWSTALYFPVEGCWEVTGRAADATLTFVVRVVKTA